MKLNIPKQKPREIPPAGSYNATCFAVVDLGTQNGPYGAKRQLWVSWELPEEETSRGKPHTVVRYYSLTASRKGNLRQDLESWFGRVFSDEELPQLDLIAELIGRTATIGVMHDVGKDGEPRAQITSIMLPRKGIPVRTATVNAPITFALDDGLDREAYNSLPEFLREIISRSPEYQAATRPDPAEGTLDKRVKAKLTTTPSPAKKPEKPKVTVAEDLDDEIPFQL